MTDRDNRRGKNRRREPQQSNHDTCLVPDEVSGHEDRPLYVLVALWCLRQEGWVNRSQISRAFGISERSATFQLIYLSRKREHICCELRKVKRGGPVESYEVKVLGVSPEAGVRKVPEKQQKAVKNIHHGRVGNADGDVRELTRNIWNSLHRGRKV
ncbi:CaiF/GrlA family transcriptional regulator [Salmonella enterica subsp. enterica serovar Corvallis]|nr:CaiF/GrlA family transcriptional regulator [Salmonella enterica subsp. enterica serovar Corvallis]